MEVGKIRSCYGLILLALAIFLTMSGCGRWSDSKIEEAKKQGDIVIAALRKFEATNGTFPKELAQLLPAYLSELPRPRVGNERWGYIVEEPSRNGFQLYVEDDVTRSADSLNFNSRKGEWRFHKE